MIIDSPHAPSSVAPARLKQFNPAFAVTQVTAGVDVAVYTRRIAMSLSPHVPADSPAGMTLATLTPPGPLRIALPLQADVEHRLSPDAATTLRMRAGVLEQAVAPLYPVLDGEHVESAEVSCLLEPFMHLAAGTTFFVRTTDVATVVYFLPAIRIDLTRGEVLPVEFPPAPSPAQITTATAEETLGDASAGSAALQLAGTLSFALPAPWGPVASAGFSLLGLLTGSSAPDIGAMITQAVTQIEDFIDARDVGSYASDIKGLLNWIAENETVLQIDAESATSYITSTILPELRKMVAPGDGSVYDAVDHLADYETEDGVFDLRLTGISLQLMAMKWIVQLDAQIASNAQSTGDAAAFAAATSLWRADYVAFAVATMGDSTTGVKGWCQEMADYISTTTTNRLAQISDVYRYDNQSVSWDCDQPDGGCVQQTNDQYGWTFTDAGAGDTPVTHFMADTTSASGCCGSSTTQYQDQVQAMHDVVVSQVATTLTAKFADAGSTINKWSAAINEWNQSLPPLAPQSAPTVAIDSAGPPTPIGADWVAGAAVAYAFAFANSSGPSPKGPWSPWCPIANQAHAVLTDWPTDPAMQATAVWIFRQFKLADGTTTPTRIVAIGQPTGTTYTDTQP